VSGIKPGKRENKNKKSGQPVCPSSSPVGGKGFIICFVASSLSLSGDLHPGSAERKLITLSKFHDLIFCVYGLHFNVLQL
jgi:hypothetical protein